jgi:hypothetical protein
VPCGIREHGVTSMAAQLKRPVTLEEVLPQVTADFERLFRVNSDHFHISPQNSRLSTKIGGPVRNGRSLSFQDPVQEEVCLSLT